MKQFKKIAHRAINFQLARVRRGLTTSFACLPAGRQWHRKVFYTFLYQDKNALALIATVMLIVFVSIAVLGITTFIVQRLSQHDTDRIKTSCIYLAQAGIQSALYWYRQNDRSGTGYFSLGSTPVGADNFFVLGGSNADLLMVNTSVARRSNRDLIGLSIQDAVDNKAITINRMIVEWSMSPARTLTSIRIAGTDRWTANPPSEPGISPADCTVNFALRFSGGRPRIDPINRLRFNGRIDNITVNWIRITFVMDDGSSKALQAYPDFDEYNFTVASTGKTTGSNIYRTIQADYNALTSRITTRYNEINTEILPPP